MQSHCAGCVPPSSKFGYFPDILEILQSMCTGASNVPSIILGDFNEDISSSQYCRIECLFTTFEINEIVQKPTTDSGTCIDHVYCNISIKYLIQ